jgi:hypothetical protein
MARKTLSGERARTLFERMDAIGWVPQAAFHRFGTRSIEWMPRPSLARQNLDLVCSPEMARHELLSHFTDAYGISVLTHVGVPGEKASLVRGRPDRVERTVFDSATNPVLVVAKTLRGRWWLWNEHRKLKAQAKRDPESRPKVTVTVAPKPPE